MTLILLLNNKLGTSGRNPADIDIKDFTVFNFVISNSTFTKTPIENLPQSLIQLRFDPRDRNKTGARLIGVSIQY